MNLRDLEYLVALAEHRHFGRAAAACQVSQPTLSTQVRRLEESLGVTLVERGPRQVLLTVAGEQIVERAREVLGRVAEIRAIAERAGDPRGGTLRLGMFPTLGPYLLPHAMAPLRAAFPKMTLQLIEEQSFTLIAQLHQGRLDAALLAMPAGDPSLHCEPVFREDFVAAIPVGHRLDDGSEPMAVAEIGQEDVLLLTEGHCLRDQALEVCGRAGTVASSGGPAFDATSLETLRHMVAAKVGMTLLPRLAVSEPVPASPDIRLREFIAPAPARSIGLHWRPSSVHADVLPELAQVLRTLPTDLVTALPAGPVR